jgi:aminoglycoside phosphotransferase (APT) family kinase protein
LQEKAPGTQLLEKMRSRVASVDDGSHAADWIATLQSLVEAPEPAPAGFNIERCRRELPAALPEHAVRIEALLEQVSTTLETTAELVPSHGDFHPMNVYVAPDRMTVIDLDTFAAREPAADVGYFIAQSAIMGYLVSDSFETTAALRRAFLDRYKAVSRHACDYERLAVYMAFAFIRSLHYDFCILHTNPEALVEPFVSAAEQCLAGHEIRLAA